MEKGYIMKEYGITLSNIEYAKNFNSTVTKYDVDMDLVNGRYVIDAKSVMGLFSLDLSKAVKLVIHSTDANKIDTIITELKEKGIELT